MLVSQLLGGGDFPLAGLHHVVVGDLGGVGGLVVFLLFLESVPEALSGGSDL